MVRLKHRYLVFHITYPDRASTGPTLFRAPTPDSVTSQLLLRVIRDSVLEHFGDYGAGAVASSLSSMRRVIIHLLIVPCVFAATSASANQCSQVFFQCYINRDCASRSGALPSRLGCPDLSNRATQTGSESVRNQSGAGERHDPQGSGVSRARLEAGAGDAGV